MAIELIKGDEKKGELARLMRTKGKHSDGGGLYLQVASPGNASWVWRHKEVWRSIGPASAYKVAEVREVAFKLRKEVAEGRDPFAMLTARRARPVGETFGEWLTKYLNKKQDQWTASNRDRERRDHERTFAQLPNFTALHIPAITPAAKADALNMLGKSAKRKATSWIDAVIRFAETGVIRERGTGGDDVEHHEAMPYRDVPTFYAGLSKVSGDDARALQWTILTGARPALVGVIDIPGLERDRDQLFAEAMDDYFFGGDSCDLYLPPALEVMAKKVAATREKVDPLADTLSTIFAEVSRMAQPVRDRHSCVTTDGKQVRRFGDAAGVKLIKGDEAEPFAVVGPDGEVWVSAKYVVELIPQNRKHDGGGIGAAMRSQGWSPVKDRRLGGTGQVRGWAHVADADIQALM
jgi:hypothetical protein